MFTVTLLICCYNGASYIDSCIQCILQQTYSNIEIIFVNDGSTDNSLKLIENYKETIEQKGMKLLIFSQKNQGAGYAASLGLQHATGDFIICFDVDDYLYPESIEKKVQFLTSHPDYDIVRTNGYEIQGTKKKLFVTNELEKNEINIFHSLLLSKTNNWAGSYMIRAKALWEIYPNHIIPGSKYGQNLQLLLAVSYKRKSGFIDEPLMKYIRNNNSFTGKKKSLNDELELLDGFRQIQNQVLETLNITDSNIKKELDIFYAQRKKVLGIDLQDNQLFISNFLILKNHNKVSSLDYYYYHKIKKELLLAWYYRVLHKLQNF